MQSFLADDFVRSDIICSFPPRSEKYHRWERDQGLIGFNNYGEFGIFADHILTARFEPVTSATVETRLIDFGTLGDSVRFKDPWFYDDAVDLRGKFNRGVDAVFHTIRVAPNNIGISSPDYAGVFLEQGNPPFWNEPHYSVGAFPTRTFTVGSQNYVANFAGWRGHPDSIQYRTPTKDTTAVIFKRNATAGAVYKVPLGSSNPSATGPNNQRKLVRGSMADLGQPGHMVMVYESAGDIFYTESSNNGTTWARERLVSDGTGKAKNPSVQSLFFLHHGHGMQKFVVCPVGGKSLQRIGIQDLAPDQG